MAERSLLCVNCGSAPPPHRRTWGRCTVCVARNLPSTYYCGEECMNAHWPKHQQYHKEQKQQAKELSESTVVESDRSVVEAQARKAERTGDEFSKRCASAMALTCEGDSNAAAKAWRKIIKQWPDLPDAYYHLALVLQRSHCSAEAVPMLLKAMELYEDDTKKWADSAAMAFDLLKDPVCDEVPKPEWWNDEGLKALSARVVALAQGLGGAYGMRARVLCGDALSKAPWNAGPRTAAEIKEAASWFRRAAEATGATLIPSAKLRCEQQASACDEYADPLLAEEEAEAAKVRAAEKAEAAEALKAAETKAAAAAEELLAEEDEEKQVAAASTKGGKAKQGKGKKGKGRR